MFLPNILMIALEVKTSLMGGVDSKTKTRVYAGDLPLCRARELMQELIKDISEELGFEDEDFKALAFACSHFEHFNSNLYSDLRSGLASQRKLLWLMLAYSVVPGISRFVGMWAQDDALDKGMPGGKFWFIPTLGLDDAGSRAMNLPVQKVVDWLIDLTGGSVSAFNKQINPTTCIEEDSVIKTLYKWKETNTIPDINKIQQYFNSKTNINFKGCFEPDESDDLELNVQKAIEFIEFKKISAIELSDEIPIKVKDIESFLNRDGDEIGERIMVEELAIRYAKPSNKKIRQRLLFARMMQDGYSRLLKYFHPNLSLVSTNSENKLLQLIKLFEHIYNASIVSKDQWEDEVEKFKSQGVTQIDLEQIDQPLFEAEIYPLLAVDVCASLMVSHGDRLSVTKNLINERLADTNRPDYLEDIIPSLESEQEKFTLDKLAWLNGCYVEQEQANELIKHLKHGDAQEALNNTNGYSLIKLVIEEIGLGRALLKLCLARMRDLAATPEQKVFPLLFELESCIHEGDKSKDGMREQVQSLIDGIFKNPEGIDLYEPRILRAQGLHALFQNDFDQAKDFLKQSFEACKAQYMGDFESAVAKDLLGLELMNNKFHDQKHRKYCRVILQHYSHNKRPMATLLPHAMNSYSDELYGRGLARLGIDDRAIKDTLAEHELIIFSDEEIALQAETRFWHELYTPYGGLEKKQRPFEQDKAELEKLFSKICDGHETELISWMSENKEFISRPLKHAQNETIVHYLLRATHEIMINTSQDDSKVEQVLRVINNAHAFIIMLFKSKPKLLETKNIFGNTPLHLAVELNNPAQTKMLLFNGADKTIKNKAELTSLELAKAKSHLDLIDLFA